MRAKEGKVNVNVSVSAEEACDKVDINQLGLKIKVKSRSKMY